MPGPAGEHPFSLSGMDAVTHWWGNLLIPTALPQQLHAQNTMGRGGKRPHPTSASTSTAREAGSDGEEAAQRTQPGFGSICSLWGTCSISQFQDSSHQSQVICCNIVAGSYSWFEEVCDVLGVLGLPQSTAGERYEISIYIPQPGQESDNLTAKVWGENSSPERQAGQERSPLNPWEMVTQHRWQQDPQSPQPLFPWGISPNSSILHFKNARWLSGPSWRQVNEGSKSKEGESSNRANSEIWGLFFSHSFNED